jgi:hypothetical protein
VHWNEKHEMDIELCWCCHFKGRPWEANTEKDIKERVGKVGRRLNWLALLGVEMSISNVRASVCISRDCR